jgi:hypothetical protein
LNAVAFVALEVDVVAWQQIAQLVSAGGYFAVSVCAKMRHFPRWARVQHRRRLGGVPPVNEILRTLYWSHSQLRDQQQQLGKWGTLEQTLP